jgi:hypothetical protein
MNLQQLHIVDKKDSESKILYLTVEEVHMMFLYPEVEWVFLRLSLLMVTHILGGDNLIMKLLVG